MTDYHAKYLKYKQKYLLEKNNGTGEFFKHDFNPDEMNLTGGAKIKEFNIEGKIDQILNFIRKSKKEKIKEELYNLIKYKDYCPIVLGEGQFEKAYIPEVNKTIAFKINNKNIDMPIVVKETKNINNPDAYAEIDILDKKLYISGYDNIDVV